MKTITTIMVSVFFISVSGTAYCGGGLPYKDTVNVIKSLLPGITSDVRKESYDYVRFDKCLLNYKVSGFYPVGTPYTKAFGNVDFSSLNYQESKVGVDSSHYIVLYFNKPVSLTDQSTKRATNTVVIDAASHDQAQMLFKAFLHLGELCGAEPGPL